MILNKNFLSFVLFLFPLTYIFGIAVSEFFVLISIIIFFFFNKKKLEYLDSKIIFLFIFSLYIFLN